MDLSDVIRAIVANPTSLQPRARLALALQSIDPVKSMEAWAATIRLAISRGQFFPALFLCRVHIPPSPLQMQLLHEMARRFGVHRHREGEILPPPIPEPWEVEMPDSLEDQILVGMYLAQEIHDLGLPINTVFPEVPIFGELPELQFVAVGAALKEVMLAAGSTFIQQGDVEQALYLLANGKVRVTQRRPDGSQVELAVVDAPAVIGEMSLLSALPRRASVSALENSLAWRIDASTINELTKQHPGLVEQLLLLVKKRLFQNLLRNSRLFRELDNPEAVLRAFQIRTVAPEEEILKQGQSAPGLYVILHGEAEVWTQAGPGQTRIRLAVLNEGDVFGEMSLLTGQPTNASVWMLEGGVLLHLPTEVYQALRNVLPGLESELAELMFVRRGELQSIASPAEGFEEIDIALVEEVLWEEESSSAR